MYRLFRCKKKKLGSKELPVLNCTDESRNTNETSAQFINRLDSKTARLMELIGHAIDDWAAEYHLENLPKKIVFEQAFDAMRAIEQIMNSENH